MPPNSVGSRFPCCCIGHHRLSALKKVHLSRLLARPNTLRVYRTGLETQFTKLPIRNAHHSKKQNLQQLNSVPLLPADKIVIKLFLSDSSLGVQLFCVKYLVANFAFSVSNLTKPRSARNASCQS